MLLRALFANSVGNGLPFALRAFRAFFLVRTHQAQIRTVLEWLFSIVLLYGELEGFVRSFDYERIESFFHAFLENRNRDF